MTDFNQAIILGNLTRDPEMRYTANGNPVISFTVATNRRWINKETQQPQEETEFHNVVAWGKLAEICNQILYKGRKVLVVGRLRTRNWEGQDGIKRYSTEIVATDVSATGPARAVGESGLVETAEAMPTSEPLAEKTEPPKAEKKKPAAAVEKKPAEQKPQSKDEEINLDDIPF